MILSYDKNANLTIDQKLDSLIENLQLALNEMSDKTQKMERELEALRKEVDASNA